MKRSTYLNGLIAVVFWISASTGSAAGATVAADAGCVRDISNSCAERNFGVARAIGPGPTVGVSEIGNGLPLILARTDGAARRQADPALALLRLFSTVPGMGDARLWLVDTGRTGGAGLFYLRFQRQTWTAGHIGDMPMGLPMAAMIATHSGALALNTP